MNEDEQRDALMRLAKSFGDAAGGMVLAFVAIASGIRECSQALDRFAEAADAAKRKPDDADRA